jgi:hypothetical protein
MVDLYDEMGLSPFGEDTGMVLPDVSNGAPDEQPSTPTGTGSGYYIPPTWETGLVGGLSSVLNTVLNRENAKTQQQVMTTSAATGIAVAQQQAKITNQRLMMFGGIAIVAFLLMGR